MMAKTEQQGRSKRRRPEREVSLTLVTHHHLTDGFTTYCVREVTNTLEFSCDQNLSEPQVEGILENRPEVNVTFVASED